MYAEEHCLCRGLSSSSICILNICPSQAMQCGDTGGQHVESAKKLSVRSTAPVTTPVPRPCQADACESVLHGSSHLGNTPACFHDRLVRIPRLRCLTLTRTTVAGSAWEKEGPAAQRCGGGARAHENRMRNASRYGSSTPRGAGAPTRVFRQLSLLLAPLLSWVTWSGMRHQRHQCMSR
jgi:hypothetical protein